MVVLVFFDTWEFLTQGGSRSELLFVLFKYFSEHFLQKIFVSIFNYKNLFLENVLVFVDVFTTQKNSLRRTVAQPSIHFTCNRNTRR